MKTLQISLRTIALAFITCVVPPFVFSASDLGEDGPPVLKYPLHLNVPHELWHLSSGWETGKIRLRINPDGEVIDWIPLELPHYGLIKAMDEALKGARFSKPTVDGEPVVTDLQATIPLHDVMSGVVLSLSLPEHIESRMAQFMPSQYQLVVSLHSELDEPIRLLSTGQSYSVVDENGVPLSGTVKVDFYIDPDGFPRMMRPDRQANFHLGQAAVMTVASMRFTPPKRNGRPTVIRVRIPIVIEK